MHAGTITIDRDPGQRQSIRRSPSLRIPCDMVMTRMALAIAAWTGLGRLPSHQGRAPAIVAGGRICAMDVACCIVGPRVVKNPHNTDAVNGACIGTNTGGINRKRGNFRTMGC